MNLSIYVQQLYAADKAALESDYETLMKQEEAQHRERMDGYAEMRNAALQRLADKYGPDVESVTVSPPETRTGG